MKCSRRYFIKAGSIAAGALFIPKALFARIHSPCPSGKSLSFYSIHTAESLDVCYFKNGQYDQQALDAINRLLRDHRTGEVKPIDTRLLEILYVVKRIIKPNSPFNVISGYRSASTNAMLYRTTTGVNKNSLHMKGRAIDIRIPGFKTSRLKETAVQIHAGGVGYYPKSNFIHVDTGPFRTW